MSVKTKLLAIANLDGEIVSKIDDYMNLGRTKLRKMIGSTLFGEYLALPIAKSVTSITDEGDGVVLVNCTSHNFVAGDEIVFEGVEDADGYNTQTVVYEVIDANSFTCYLYYVALADLTDATVISIQRYDMEMAEAYLVLYEAALMIYRWENNYPFAQSAQFGEGEINPYTSSEFKRWRDKFLNKASEYLSAYLGDAFAGDFFMLTIEPYDEDDE